MSFERTLEGTITFINRQNRTLEVTPEGKREGGSQSIGISFRLAASVSVISSRRGMLKLAKLKVGQRVLVHYVTEFGGKCVAHTIALIESTTRSGSFSGVQVAV